MITVKVYLPLSLFVVFLLLTYNELLFIFKQDVQQNHHIWKIYPGVARHNDTKFGTLELILLAYVCIQSKFTDQYFLAFPQRFNT